MMKVDRKLVLFLTFVFLTPASSFAKSLLDSALSTPFTQSNWVVELFERLGADYGVEVSRGSSTQGPQTDETNPRVDIHASKGPQQVFVGINRKTGESEAFEWNTETQSYDFLKIKDIRCKTPCY